MYLVVIAWLYVVLMMSAAEAASPQGTVLGAIMTFVLYGLLPLSILIYIMGTGARRRARKASEINPSEALTQAMPAGQEAVHSGSGQPDAGGHASSGLPGGRTGPAAAAPVREER